MTESPRYEQFVNYDLMDPFKIKAQRVGLDTASFLFKNGFREVKESRGESVYLLESLEHDFYLAFLVEGLGTKNRVAELMYELLKGRSLEEDNGERFFNYIAQCNAAMSFNDLATLGATPLVFGMHLAAGDSAWFKDERRYTALIEGTKDACVLGRATYGPGETPTLKDVVMPDTVVLSGAMLGIIKHKNRRLNPKNIRAGDRILFIKSSGVHANGLSLARQISAKLPKGYLTKLPDGHTYGEALLGPTLIYSPLVEDCLQAGVKIHYAVHVSGHGWRKLMRAQRPFSYHITTLPEPLLPIFEFIQNQGHAEEKEMYGTFNMGVGFALYLPEGAVGKVIAIAAQLGLAAFDAGEIRESEDRKVVIEPKGIEFHADELNIR